MAQPQKGTDGKQSEQAKYFKRVALFWPEYFLARFTCLVNTCFWLGSQQRGLDLSFVEHRLPPHIDAYENDVNDYSCYFDRDIGVHLLVASQAGLSKPSGLYH